MPADSAQTEDLLGVAAEHATSRIPTARTGETAAAVRSSMTGGDFDYADEIAVLDDGTLAGLLSIERLLPAPNDQRIDELMDPDPPVVAPGVDQEQVARRMVEHGESGIVVVDADRRFVGLIPAHRMLDVLLDRHERDLARMSGYLSGARQARGAAEENVRRRLWHRLPWLLIGLAGAMISAVVMAAYEEQLDEMVLISFFVPAVVYLAGAVGVQTETVLIRGLTAGVAIRRVMWREIVTGLIIGVMLGAAFFAFALIVWGDSTLATAVAISLFATCSIASVIALVLPWAFQRAGADPAFGAGPLATVIEDLFSILVYLAVATSIVG